MKQDAFRTLFPIQYEEMWKMYKAHVQGFWTAEEISFHDDRRQFDALPDEEKRFIRYVLAFFANSESVVSENLAARFYQEITIPEVRCFLGWQIANENVHYEAYALQIEEYTDTMEEKEELFAAIENVPCIAAKAEWAERWLYAKANLLQRLLGFGLVEGVFFASSFCAIYYFRKRGLLPGLAQSNDWIARDESLHFTFSSLLFRAIRHAYLNDRTLLSHMLSSPDLVTEDISVDVFNAMVLEAIDIEQRFVEEAIPLALIGMNAELMTRYVRSRANEVARLFGYPKVFTTDADNPFDFMRALDVPNVTNFFEKRVTDYQRPSDRRLHFDEEF